MILALIEKLELENRTFTALSNAITSILQQPNFELSTNHEEINPSGHDVHAITGTGAGKRSAGACRCCRTTTCPGGLYGLVHFCLASNRHGAPLPPDVSHVPSASVAACKVAKAAHVPGARSPGAGAGGGAGGGGSKACWAFKSSGTCRFGLARTADFRTAPPLSPLLLPPLPHLPPLLLMPSHTPSSWLSRNSSGSTARRSRPRCRVTRPVSSFLSDSLRTSASLPHGGGLSDAAPASGWNTAHCSHHAWHKSTGHCPLELRTVALSSPVSHKCGPEPDCPVVGTATHSS